MTYGRYAHTRSVTGRLAPSTSRCWRAEYPVGAPWLATFGSMTVALAVVAAVALVVAAALAWRNRARRGELGEAEARADQLTARLAEAVDLLGQIEQEKRGVEVRAGGAEGRARAAEQKAADAERRSGEAEKRVAEAMRRADDVVRAQAESPEARAIWQVERLRVEREWMDVVGPGVGLPADWDGTIGAVVATELSVIREVIGTPSQIVVSGGRDPSSSARTAASARIAVELLRTLARSGEEMEVLVAPGTVTVSQVLRAGEAPPDLSALASVARAGGFELDVEVSEGRSEVRLQFS